MSLHKLLDNRDRAVFKIDRARTPHERKYWQEKYRDALYKLKKYDEQRKGGK